MRLSSVLLARHARSLRPALGLALAALLTAAACTSSDDPSGTPGPAGGNAVGDAVALDQVGAQLAPVYCEILKTCQGAGFDLAFPQAASCQQQITDNYVEATYPTLKAAVDAGKATYDGTKLASCLDLIKAQGCAFPATRIEILCPGLLVGKVAEGGACTASSECTPGDYCKVDAACPGKCAPLEAAGVACKQDEDCASGLDCDGTPSVCVKPVGAEEPCEQGKPPCALGTVCVGQDSGTKTPGTCKTYDVVLSGAQGAACNVAKTQLCVPVASCAVDKISASGATYVCAAKVASGAACKLAVPTMCPVGEFCDGIDTKKAKFDGTCKVLPTQGQPCASNIGGQGCAEGLVCGKDLTCKARGKNGVACADPSECYGSCVGGVCVAENACTM